MSKSESAIAVPAGDSVDEERYFNGKISHYPYCLSIRQLALTTENFDTEYEIDSKEKIFS